MFWVYFIIIFWVIAFLSFHFISDTDGRVDMKRIYGITAVEGRVRPGKGVKVALSLSAFFFEANLTTKIKEE